RPLPEPALVPPTTPAAAIQAQPSPHPQAIPLEPPPGIHPQAVPVSLSSLPRSRQRWGWMLALGSAAVCLVLAGGLAFGWRAAPWVQQGTRQPPGGWGNASSSATNGDLRLGVLLIDVQDEPAVLFVLAENTSTTKKIDFVDDLSRPIPAYPFQVTDEFGN